MKRIKVLLMIVLSVMIMGCTTESIFDESEQLAIDRQLILDYLDQNNINAVEIGETGIFYAVTQSGSGPTAEFASSVFTHYRGYLLDGTEFDSSAERGVFDFVVGAGAVIQGWEIAFQELNRGTSATLFIPSKYGYGTSRQGTIPANSVLIFDVDVVDIR